MGVPVSIVLGIDPGLDGGLAFLDTADDRATVLIAPTLSHGKGGGRVFDVPSMFAMLTKEKLDLIVIERVSAAPVAGRVQGALSMFNFGCGFGLWLGLFAGLRLPHQLVSPQAWKAAILSGTKKDKAAAIEFAGRRYPAVSLRPTPRCKKPHDGLADALCLAEYARRVLAGSVM